MIRTLPEQALVNLLDLDSKAVSALVEDLGWPRYRASQILRWLHRSRVTTIERMSNLSATDRSRLQQVAKVSRTALARRVVARDETTKYVFDLSDGLQVESVLIPEGRRLTLCLSTQVGCTLDCAFCLTGKMGLKRNLKAHEIVDQVMTVQDDLPHGRVLNSLVLMGMGEPLANFDAVREAVTRLTNRDWGLGFSPRRITLSTAGLSGRFKDVAELGVNLAVSLNATDEGQRAALMPAANRLHPLSQLLKACREYPLPPGRRLTFEYVLLAGVNDSLADAKRLQALLRGIRCKVNLIPFNEFPMGPFARPSDDVVLAFQAKLREGGYDVFIRKRRGHEVLGACGQLGTLERGGTTPGGLDRRSRGS